MVEALLDGDSVIPIDVSSFDDARDIVTQASLIVNATPVGLYPHAHDTPWPHVDSFRPGQVVYDLVYNPMRTRFLREARDRGATTLNGSEMLIAQAAAAHTLWTGLRMPVADVREAVIRALGGRVG